MTPKKPAQPADAGDSQNKEKGKAPAKNLSNEIVGKAPASAKHPVPGNTGNAGHAGHDGAAKHGQPVAKPAESGLSKLVHQGEHLLAAGGKMISKALGSHDDKYEKTAASKRPEIPNKVAHADKLSSEERRHQKVSDYTDPVTKKHFHYNDRGLVDKIHGVNGAVTTINYRREGNVDKPVAFTTIRENQPNLVQSAKASDKVVLKVDQRTGDVTTSCHQKVTVLDEQRKPVSQEIKVERQFSSEGACSEVRSDLKGHRIDKSIVGPDNKPVAVIHYNYRHDAGKTDAEQSVTAVQLDAQGRPVHQFVFATAGDIDKQKPSMREDRKYSEADGLIKESHKLFDVHTGKDVPMFQSEQTLDMNKGRTTIHEQTFKDGSKTPAQDKTTTFDESGKPIELRYKNTETKTDVTLTFTNNGKAADVKGKLGELDKQQLLQYGDVEVANTRTHYQVSAIETADLLAHGGPTPPREGRKPTGTVAWKEGETYKQGSVVDGNVLDANRKVIGTVNDAGDVEIGTVKFNILSDQSRGAVFHGVGTDLERLDLCLGQSSKGSERNEGYNGYLTDGQEKMTAIGGNVFDKHGKFFAHMDAKGVLTFADDTDQKEKNGTGLSSIKSGSGWKFIGNENGKSRQFDVDNSCNGTVFVAQLDAKGAPLLDASGKPIDPVKCTAQMGMLIDTTTGKQIGKFVPPAVNDDKSWGEGAVLLFGKNPGDKPTLNALSSMKNTVFDVTMTGQGTIQTMRGAVVGPKELQADGSTRPGVGGIVNFDQALAVSEQNLQSKKAALGERIDTENNQAMAIGIATHDVTGLNAQLYNKAIAGEEQTEAARVGLDLATRQNSSEKARIDQVLTTGKVDENTVYSLQRMTTLNKGGGLDTLALLKQRVENPQHVLEDLKGSAQIYSGTIKRPDPEHPGKMIDYDVKEGYVYKKNSDHIIGSVNPADGSLRLLNDAGRAEVSRMADPTLKGSVIHLESLTESGKTSSVDWVNDGRGQLISIGQLRKQAAEERAYAELMAKGDASGTTNKEALERTKVLEARYTKTLNDIVQNGITDVNSVDRFSALEQLKGGPQAYVKAEHYRAEPHAAEKKISVPKFNTQEDCQRASGPMRLGNDHYVVDKGVIYRARLEGQEWKKEDKPCGNLEANYVAKIDGNNVVLRDQTQFLFQLRLEGESQEHRIIGLGPSRADANGAITPGGLVDANELLRQGELAQSSTAVSAKEYRDSEGYITLGIPDAAMGGRAAQLDLVHDTAENQQRAMQRQIDQLFIEGLSGHTLATTDVNHNVRSVRNFVQDMHLSIDDASELSAEGREMQKQSSEAVAMAALGVVPGGAGLLATRVGFGVVGRVGITMAGGGLVSTIARQTHGGGWQEAGDNFASGTVEALTMWAGSEGTQLLTNLKVIQTAKIGGPALPEALQRLAANPMAETALKVMSNKYGAYAVEGLLRTGNASMQTVGFATSGAIRSGNYDEFTAMKMAEGTFYMMTGEGLAALAHHPLTKKGPNVRLPFGKEFEKGMETFSGGAINNFANSVLNARGQAELAEKEHIAQQLNLKPDQITSDLYEKYKNQSRINAFILRSGAEGAAMTVVSHPVNHFFGQRVEQVRRAQLHSEQIASIEARINAAPMEDLARYNSRTIKNDVGLETTLTRDQNGLLKEVILPDGNVLKRDENQWASSNQSSTFRNIQDVIADGHGNILIKHTNSAETNIYKDGRTTEKSVPTDGHEIVKTCFPDGRTSTVETVDGKVTALTTEKAPQLGGTESSAASRIEMKKVTYDEHGNLKSVEEKESGSSLVKDEAGWSRYSSDGKTIEKGFFSDVKVLADGTIIKESKSKQDGSSQSITNHPDGSELTLKNGVVDSILDAKGYKTTAVRDGDGKLVELQQLDQGRRLVKGDDGWTVHKEGYSAELLRKDIRLESDGSVVYVDEHGIVSTHHLDGSSSLHVPGDSVAPVLYRTELKSFEENLSSIEEPMTAARLREGLLDLHDRLRQTHDAPDEEVAKVLYEVNRLLKEPGCVSEQRRRQWVDEALSLAANPDLLSQGENGTCPLASSEQREYALHPDTWFKMLRRLNETGVAVNASGGVIDTYAKDGQFGIAPDEGALANYNEPGRTRRDNSRLEVSQIVQTVLNDVVFIQTGRRDVFYASDIEPMMKFFTGRDEKFVIENPRDSKDMLEQALSMQQRATNKQGHLYAILKVDASQSGARGMLSDQGHVQIIKEVRSNITGADKLSSESTVKRFRMDGMAIRDITDGAAQPSYELDTSRIDLVLGNTRSRSKSREVLTVDQAYSKTITPKSPEHLDRLEARIKAKSTDPYERLELLSWKLGILNESLVHRINNTGDTTVERALTRLKNTGPIDSAQMLQELNACEKQLKHAYIERARSLDGEEKALLVETGINELLEQKTKPFQSEVPLSLKEREYMAALGDMKRVLGRVQEMENELAKRPANSPPNAEISSASMPANHAGNGHGTAMVSNDVQRAVGAFKDASSDLRDTGETNPDAVPDFSSVLQGLHQAREAGASIEDGPGLNFKEGAGIPDDYMKPADSENDSSDQDSKNTKKSNSGNFNHVSNTPTKLTPEPVSEVENTPLPPPPPLPFEHHQKLEAARIQDKGNQTRIGAGPDSFDSIPKPDPIIFPGKTSSVQPEKSSAGQPDQSSDVQPNISSHVQPEKNPEIYLERTPDLGKVQAQKLGDPVVELRGNLLRELAKDPQREQIDSSDPNQMNLIQERKNRENEKAYARLSRIDPLTGAGTQQTVEEELIVRCEQAQKDKQPFSVAYIDLDEFGTANRVIGRPGGDLALTMFAEAMDRVLVDYPGISLARLGGDEFVLIGSFDEKFLQDVRAIRLAYESRDGKGYVRQMREQEVVGKLDAAPVRASIGAVAWREGESPEQILKRADKEMKANKDARKFGDALNEFKPEIDSTKAPSDEVITSKFQRNFSMTSKEFRAQNSDLFFKRDDRSNEATVDRLILAKRLYTHHLTELPKDFICHRVLGREVYQVSQAAKTSGGEQKLFLIKADINNFKSVNDENDHSQGDALLKIYGADLRQIVGSGKDKFVGSPGGGAAFIIAHSEAERDMIVQRLEAWTGPEDMQPKDQYKLSLSVGVAEWKPGMSANKLDESANEALIAVKTQQEEAGIRKSREQYAEDARVKEEEKRRYRERTPDMNWVEDLKVGAPLVDLRRGLLRDLAEDPTREQIDKGNPNSRKLTQERKNRENEEAYARLSKIDPLTGAGTQQAVEDELIMRCEKAQKDKTPFSVAYIDLDEFGTANGVIDRPGGDLALTMFVEEMNRILDKNSGISLARLGGDEFVLIGSFDEKFLEAVRSIRLDYGIKDEKAYVRVMRDGEPVTGVNPVRASIGGVAWREGETAEQIFKRADKEMQANKNLRKYGRALREFNPEVDSAKAPSDDAITSQFQRRFSMTSDEFRAKNPDFAKMDGRSREASVDRLILAKSLYTHHLTGLPKDFVCQRVLRREVYQANQTAKAEGNEQKLFLIKADINNFKSINDEYDHSQGDALLKLYGADLRKIVGSGKDKFVGSPSGGAAFIIAHSEAERDMLVKQLESWTGPAEIQPKDQYKLGLSIAVAEWTPGMTASDLDVAANRKLVEVKTQQEAAGIRKSREQYALEAKLREEHERANRNPADRGNQD